MQLNHVQNMNVSSHLPNGSTRSAVFNLVPIVLRSSFLWKEKLTVEHFALVSG